MASEDKGSGVGSSDDSSLAARRARLRGTLAKQVASPDPYASDQYSSNTASSAVRQSQTPATPNPPVTPAATAPATTASDSDFNYPSDDEFGQPDSEENGGNGSTAKSVSSQQSAGVQAWEDPQPFSTGAPSYASAPAAVPQEDAEPAEAKPRGGKSSMPAAGVMYEAWTQARGGLPDESSDPSTTATGDFPAIDPNTRIAPTPSKNEGFSVSSSWSQMADAIESTDAPPPPRTRSVADLVPPSAGTRLPSPKQIAKESAPEPQPEPIKTVPEPIKVTDDWNSTIANVADEPQTSASQDVADVAINEPEAAIGAGDSAMIAPDEEFEMALDDAAEIAPEPQEEVQVETPKATKELKEPKDTVKSRQAADPADTDEPAATTKPATKSTPSAGISKSNGSTKSPPVVAAEESSAQSIGLAMPMLAQIDPKMQAQTIEVLNNIDQGMGACAMNLSALQKIANEQTEALKALADTMQGQNFFEIGLNLNSIVETMSAALEPMKAVGELVPAIDQLVVALETRDATPPRVEEERLTPEQLVMNLADQLSAHMIDPWTFKCAYLAIYPDEKPAQLVNRLANMLGAQRLNSDVFKAAYEAIQAEAQPAPVQAPPPPPEIQIVTKVVPDEAVVAELEQVRRTNEELRQRLSESANAHDDVKLEELQSVVAQMQTKLDQRELEFADVLAAKERELQDAQELLTSRWEEFNARYDELTETLQKRDEMLAEKEAELSRKESENLQLKTQIEELRDQTKDMVSDLQRQLSAATAAAAKTQEAAKSSGFFEPGGAGGAQQQQQQPNQLFDAAPARPLFQPAVNAQQQQPVDPAPQVQQAPMAPQQQPQMNQAAPAASAQAIPRPATPTTPFLTGGSYGSGVRAQVFEVIVRQALAGAPWREICAGPMSVNNISPEEVEAEVKRRQALLKK